MQTGGIASTIAGCGGDKINSQRDHLSALLPCVGMSWQRTMASIQKQRADLPDFATQANLMNKSAGAMSGALHVQGYGIGFSRVAVPLNESVHRYFVNRAIVGCS